MNLKEIVNTVVCGDCLEVMKGIPDKSIDLIFADPDYNAKTIGPKHRTYIGGMPRLPVDKYKKFCQDWFNEAKRIGKRIVITSGIANICNYPQPHWIICWHKPAAVSFNWIGGYNAWEPILVYGGVAKKKRVGIDYVLFNTLNSKKGPEKEHPCPKPLRLIKWIIDKFSCEEDIVLDPFLGSGTTAVACKELGRRFIGIEIKPEYCEIAEKRLSQEMLF